MKKPEGNKGFYIKIDKSQKEAVISAVLAIALIFGIDVVFMKIMYPNRGLLYIICTMFQSLGSLIQNNWKICIVILLFFAIRFIRSWLKKRKNRQLELRYLMPFQNKSSEIRSMISNTKNNLLKAEREIQIFKEKVYKLAAQADLIVERYENSLRENQELLKQIENQFTFEAADMDKLQKMGFYLNTIDNFATNVHTEYMNFQKQINEENNKKNYESKDKTDNPVDMFFAGCNDKDSVTKRYRQLMKTFHPDNQNGDQTMTQNIQDAYEKMMTNVI